jgi:hypothetical protein
MRMQRLAPIAIGASMVVCGAAHAQDPVKTDLRCAVLAFQMSVADDPAMKSAGMMTAFYYLGRLDARLSPADLEPRLTEEIASMTSTMTVDAIQTQARLCGAILTARGEALVSMGNRMIAKEKSTEPQKK